MKSFLGALFVAFLLSFKFAKAAELYDAFVNPPVSAAPHVWWHWMNGNVTKQGITADLEAMKKIGLAGAQSFDCGCGIPFGGIKFNSPQWYEMILHAHNEAKRLGLELCLANCSGYSASGGPWVKSEDAMKEVVVEEITALKGERVYLPVTSVTNGFYRDIAVVAFPTPKGISYPTKNITPKVVVNDKLVTETYFFTLPNLTEISELKCSFKPRDILWEDNGRVEILVEKSQDGNQWDQCFECVDNATPNYSISDKPHYHIFDKVKARFYRVTFKYKELWCMKSAKLEGVELGTFMRLPGYDSRLLFTARQSEDNIRFNKDGVVDLSSVLVLPPKFDASSRLDWQVPDGSWTIMRIGYRNSGRKCSPASDYGEGYEVDKLDKNALDRFFDSYVAKLVKVCGINPKEDPVGRAGFNAILVDSWEVGSQNWTHGFEKSFESRNGYSLLRFLPCFAGFVVGSLDQTFGFCKDLRRTVEELFAENYADRLAERCRESGLMLSVEPYSSQPCSSARYARNVQLPMTEFWCSSSGQLQTGNTCKYVSSISHVRGRKYTGAESFTTHPEEAGWRQTPKHYKAVGDLTYTHGVNRIIYHRFAHQPWVSEYAKPGMTMGPWGTHFERTLTWWDFACDWIKYQTRCQYMLQEGKPAADILFYVGSKTPQDAIKSVREGDKPSANTCIPRGYDYDFIGTDSLKDLTVTKEGRIKTAGGVEYAFLAAPRDEPIFIKGATTVSHDEIKSKLKDIKPRFQSLDTDLHWISRDYADGSQAWFICLADREKPHVADVILRDSQRFVPQIWDAVTGERFIPKNWSRLEDGRAKITLELEPSASCFVVFAPDGERVSKEKSFTIKQDVLVKGPWDVSFKEPRRGAPKAIKLAELCDLSKHEKSSVRYFSGTCVYKTKFVSPEGDWQKIVIDLGKVGELARVTVNGLLAPHIAWNAPYQLDITKCIAKGTKEINLEIEVVNTWVNRIIGDVIEDKPMDWKWKGRRIKEIPQFIKDGQESPNGRHAFYTFRFYYKSNANMIPPSGLIGPVTVSFLK